MRLTDHAQCHALAGCFGGKLCEALAANRPGRRLSAGEFLYLPGDPARSTYQVRSGLVKTGLISSNGDEITFRLHKAGEFLGESCLCTGERREHARALEDSEIVELPFADFIAHLQRNPEALFDFLRTVSERLAEVNEQLLSLSADRVEVRLVRTLLRLADELGEPTATGVRIAHYLSQEELAKMVGARREVVSGVLNQLRKKELVGYSRKGPIQIDRSLLAAYLDSIE